MSFGKTGLAHVQCTAEGPLAQQLHSHGTAACGQGGRCTHTSRNTSPGLSGVRLPIPGGQPSLQL